MLWASEGGGSHETLLVSDHPVCAVSEASRNFIDGAATPPHEEGILLSIRLFVPASLLTKNSEFLKMTGAR